MIQTRQELEEWYKADDPWGYEFHVDDVRRKHTLLAELPERTYRRVLDIGCGHGFITRELPGVEVIGVDVSLEAIRQANQHATARVRFMQASIFDLDECISGQFDLIVITGVLYPQYVGRALSTIYRSLVRLLAEDGLLMSVHISEWSQARFPLLRVREHLYPYRGYTHRLELYIK